MNTIQNQIQQLLDQNEQPRRQH